MNDVKTIECKRDFAIGADGENFVSFKETAWAHNPQ
jgi:hypothetical protein